MVPEPACFGPASQRGRTPLAMKWAQVAGATVRWGPVVCFTRMWMIEEVLATSTQFELSPL